MPTFVFTDPNGKKHKVTGPEGSTADEALAILQSQGIAPTPPQQSVGEKVGEGLVSLTKKAPDVLQGTVELPAALVTGAIGNVAGHIAGAGQWLNNAISGSKGRQPIDAFRTVSEALTYKPTSVSGQASLDAVNTALGATAGKAGEFVGDVSKGMGADPYIEQATRDTATTIATLGLAKGAAKGAGAAAQGAKWVGDKVKKHPFTAAGMAVDAGTLGVTAPYGSGIGRAMDYATDLRSDIRSSVREVLSKSRELTVIRPDGPTPPPPGFSTKAEAAQRAADFAQHRADTMAANRLRLEGPLSPVVKDGVEVVPPATPEAGPKVSPRLQALRDALAKTEVEDAHLVDNGPSHLEQLHEQAIRDAAFENRPDVPHWTELEPALSKQDAFWAKREASMAKAREARAQAQAPSAAPKYEKPVEPPKLGYEPITSADKVREGLPTWAEGGPETKNLRLSAEAAKGLTADELTQDAAAAAAGIKHFKTTNYPTAIDMGTAHKQSVSVGPGGLPSADAHSLARSSVLGPGGKGAAFDNLKETQRVVKAELEARASQPSVGEQLSAEAYKQLQAPQHDRKGSEVLGREKTEFRDRQGERRTNMVQAKSEQPNRAKTMAARIAELEKTAVEKYSPKLSEADRIAKDQASWDRQQARNNTPENRARMDAMQESADINALSDALGLPKKSLKMTTEDIKTSGSEKFPNDKTMQKVWDAQRAREARKSAGQQLMTATQEQPVINRTDTTTGSKMADKYSSSLSGKNGEFAQALAKNGLPDRVSMGPTSYSDYLKMLDDTANKGYTKFSESEFNDRMAQFRRDEQARRDANKKPERKSKK